MTASRWAIAAALLCASTALRCGGNGGDASGETSVVLDVRNGAGLPRPDEVRIDVYTDASPSPRDSLSRSVQATGDRLGDLVVFPGAGTATLRFVIEGRLATVAVSFAEVTATVMAGKQVRAQAELQGALGGGGGMGGDVHSDAAGQEGGSAGSGVDAGAPEADAAEVTDVPVTGGMGGTDAGGALAGAGGTAGTAGGAGGMAGTGGSPVDAGPTKKATGVVCGGSAECQSGECKDGVCCDRSCGGECRGCKVAGQPVGRCAPRPTTTACGSRPRCRQNVLSHQRCDGQGACQDETVSCRNMNLTCNADKDICE